MTNLKKVKLKLVFAIVLIIVFFGTLATVLIFNKTKDNFIELKEKDLKTITLLQAGHIDQIFIQSKGLAKALAENSCSSDFLIDKEGRDHEAMLETLENFNTEEYYSAIYLMDQDGDTLVSTDSSFEGKNYGFRRYFQKAMAGEAFVDMAIGVTSKKPGYYFSHPVKDGDSILGVVVFKLKPEVLDRIVYLNRLRTDDDIILTNEFSIAVSTNKKNTLYRILGESLLDEDIKIIEEGKNFSVIDFGAPYFYLSEYKKIKRVIDSMRPIKAENSYWYFEDEKKAYSITKVSNHFPLFLIREADISALRILGVKNASWLSLIVAICALFAMMIIIIAILKMLNPKNLKETENNLEEAKKIKIS